MKKTLNILLSVIMGLCIAFIICEIVLNIYNPFGFRQKGNKIVLPSNFVMNYKNETIRGLDTIIKHSKNKLGFRGPNRPKYIDKFTSIITVGGSTTECYYISDDKEWVSLMAKNLKNQFNNLWVNNAGLDGHSTFGHQILLDDELLKLKPNYLLFLIGCNDIERKDLKKYDERILKPTNWKTFLKDNSEFLSLMSNLKRSYNARMRNCVHHDIDFESLEFVDSISNEKLQQIIDYHRTFNQGFEFRLKKLVKTSKESNIIPILITQPTLVGKGFDEPTGIDLEKVKYCDEYGGKVYFEILESYNEITRKVAKNEGIHVIDLAQQMPKSTENFYDCVHFTNKGAEIVSQIVYEDMKEILKLKYKL